MCNMRAECTAPNASLLLYRNVSAVVFKNVSSGYVRENERKHSNLSLRSMDVSFEHVPIRNLLQSSRVLHGKTHALPERQMNTFTAKYELVRYGISDTIVSMQNYISLIYHLYKQVYSWRYKDDWEMCYTVAGDGEVMHVS